MSPKQRFNITLEPEHIEALRNIEKSVGGSASEHIRRAVAAYVKAMAPVVRAAERKDQSRGDRK